MKIGRMDHVGIIVQDILVVQEFFLTFGLEVVGEAEVDGEWIERIIGLQDFKRDIVVLRTPDGEANIELIKYHLPIGENGQRVPLANTPGIWHIAFTVERMEALVAKLQGKGIEFIGEIQTYEDTYKVCFCRGPEGIIVELAEKVK